MSFQLAPNAELAAAVLTQSLAEDAVQLASQFDQGVIDQYKAMFINYWKVGREFTREQLQARSNRMGVTELAILLKAGGFVQAILQMGGELESKFHTPPYEYELVDIVFADGHAVATLATFDELFVQMQTHGPFTLGRVVLGDLKDDWQPAQPTEPEPEPEPDPE